MNFESRLIAIMEKWEKKQDREFSSTQVDLPGDIADKLSVFASTISKEDLANDGVEDNSHITVKFGLHTNNPDEVRPLLEDEPPVILTLGKMGIFRANENRDSDVLIINIDSEDLHRLNKKIRDNLECTDTYPTYKPHATIAYLKPGRADNYVSDDFEGIGVTVDFITFSGKDRKKMKLKLGGCI